MSRIIYLVTFFIFLSCGVKTSQKKKITNVESKTKDISQNFEIISLPNASNQDLGEVRIGTQIWAIKNLSVDTYSNVSRTVIYQIKTKEDFMKCSQSEIPAFAIYNNDSAHLMKYGRLYNWWAVNFHRGLAPKGWRIPTEQDWDILVEYVGGGKSGNALKTTTGWEKGSEGFDGNGTNTTGFSALPSGFMEFYRAIGVGTRAAFWTSTIWDTRSAYAYILTNEHMTSDMWSQRNLSKEPYYQDELLSVRCIR